VKNITPVQSLILLVLIGIAVSGWFYGVYWKRVASGSLFSPDEKVLIRLQDQISTLHEQNVKLQEQNADPAPQSKD